MAVRPGGVVVADTIKDLRTDLHGVDKRLATLEAVSEERHESLMAAIAKLAEDLSDAGKTPAPVDRAGTSGRIVLPVSWTPMEIAKAALVVVPILAGIWGVSYSGAQSGGSTGATSAVEDAVEQAEAIPVAAPPTIRVVPVPVPVPVEPEPDPVPDDLMPLP